MTQSTAAETASTKSWIALVGTLLLPVGALIAQFAGVLPEPYGTIAAGLGALISLITKKVVYEVPNKPKDPDPVNHPPYTPPPPSSGGGWPTPPQR